MKVLLSSVSLISLSLLINGSAIAQDMPFDTLTLPDVCNVSAAHNMDNMQMSTEAPDASASSGPNAALQESMNGMHDAMSQAMNAKDIDVAFACGMIPHHLGAIAMAKVQLEFGDDEWVREVAANVISAQEAEIAEMVDWLQMQ